MEMTNRTYTREALLTLAKRVNNPKRSYLLVDPLQGKHIPVKASSARTMMAALGEQLRNKVQGTYLVIGFAETATAVASVVAETLGGDCFLCLTTREPEENVREWLTFEEEHSHATTQKLCLDGLEEELSRAGSIILVDDEISTGRTLINIVNKLKSRFSMLAGKSFVAASLINRVDEEHLRLLAEANIRCEALLTLPNEDYDSAVAGIDVCQAPPAQPGPEGRPSWERAVSLPDPRRGVRAGAYRAACAGACEELAGEIAPRVRGKRVRVLGTEECMFPGLLLAERLEREGAASVLFHATTRSPIGLSGEENYPIFNGYSLPSFYEHARNTYLYDIGPCDLLIVWTDAHAGAEDAWRCLTGLKEWGGAAENMLIYGK